MEDVKNNLTKKVFTKREKKDIIKKENFENLLMKICLDFKIDNYEQAIRNFFNDRKN